MLSNCCQLSRWLPFTKKKATFQRHFISGWLCANILSIRSPLNYFLVDKETFCPLMLDWPSLCFHFFSWKSISNHFLRPFPPLAPPTPPHHSLLPPSLSPSHPPPPPPAMFLSIHERLTEHTSSVSASPCFTFTQSHTHSSPGSFRGQPSYWAASLEQMGLRAKAVHWLLPFFIFLHSAHRRWNYASSCIDSGRQMEARQFRLSTGVALASAPSFMLHRLCLIHQLLRYQLNSNI